MQKIVKHVASEKWKDKKEESEVKLKECRKINKN